MTDSISLTDVPTLPIIGSLPNFHAISRMLLNSPEFFLKTPNTKQNVLKRHHTPSYGLIYFKKLFYLNVHVHRTLTECTTHISVSCNF